MKRSTRIVVAAVIGLAVLSGAYFVQPPEFRRAVTSSVQVPTGLWNSYQDIRLRYFTPAQTFSGTIESISPTNGSFLLATTPTCGLPIIIDPHERAAFRNHVVNEGDVVTVRVRTRISASRKYGQYYLRSIQVDLPGFKRPAPPSPPADFSQPISLFVKPQQPSVDSLIRSATTLPRDYDGQPLQSSSH